MKTIRSTLILTLALTAACGGGHEAANLNVPTWEAFELEARRVHEGKTFYVVDGDIPITHDQLRELYARKVHRAEMEAAGIEIGQDSTPLLIHQYLGGDDVWTEAQAANLTYCVTTDFGPVNHARMVEEMAQATAAWERVAGVDFIYDGTHDGNCRNTNPNVVFSVRPTTMSGACAFFPNDPATYGCVAKTLIINIGSIDNNPGFGATTTLGVLKHELGHILGFRHEHARVPNSRCVEPGTRAVTAYDSASVMHYPWCPGGTQTGDLVITDLDAIGADIIYPKYPGCNDDAFVMDGPYARLTNGSTFRKTSTYREYPVYSRDVSGQVWSIYRRENGLWYLDFNAVDESWDGTVAHSLSPGPDPFSARWNSLGMSQVTALHLSGGPYSALTNGTYTLTTSYNGSPVYQRTASGYTFSIYRRDNDEWFLDFDEVDERWNGTLSHTSETPMTPYFGAIWSARDIVITPTCTL